MKGFPFHFATKEDYENIIRDFPKWRGRVLKQLKALQDTKDNKVTRAVSLINPNDPESDWITKEMPNPFPKYQQKGFKTKKKLNNLIAEVEVKEKKDK